VRGSRVTSIDYQTNEVPAGAEVGLAACVLLHGAEIERLSELLFKASPLSTYDNIAAQQLYWTFV